MSMAIERAGVHRFGIGPLHKLITNTAYKGEHRFNRRSAKAEADNPEDEQIIVPVPAIIDEKTFDAVQAQLKARNPKKTPPRTVTGPILLTGLAKCAHCGGGMTLRTGKGGRYRYYACASKAQKGKSACKGRAVPMDELDDQITRHLSKRLLTPERTEELLKALIKRQADRKSDHGKRVIALQGKRDESQGKLDTPL